jgi:hypothetical protein
LDIQGKFGFWVKTIVDIDENIFYQNCFSRLFGEENVLKKKNVLKNILYRSYVHHNIEHILAIFL